MTLDSARLSQAVRHLRRRDPVLAGIIGRVGRCAWETERGGSAFASLIEAMLYQQITGKAAQNAYGLDELPDARWLKERGEAWRPYRTVASWYLWRSLERKKP